MTVFPRRTVTVVALALPLALIAMAALVGRNGVGKMVLAQTASVQESFVYDRFNGSFIDPQKWASSAFSYCMAQTTLDCARELLHGNLHLLIRTYGNNGSDQGTLFDNSFLNFTNPASVKSMAADVVIPNDA